MGRATLAPRLGMSAEAPPLRSRPLATMKRHGHGHGGHGRHGHGRMADAGPGGDAGMDHAGMGHDMSGHGVRARHGGAKPRGSDVMGKMDGMNMSMRDRPTHPRSSWAPGVQMIAPMPMDRTAEPGQGLASVGHRVLVYQRPRGAEPNPDIARAVTRRPGDPSDRQHGAVHVGVRRAEVQREPQALRLPQGRAGAGDPGQRHHDGPPDPPARPLLRADPRAGRTTAAQAYGAGAPGGKCQFDFTADPGDWAFHCHMLYHMHAGMFQVFAVRPLDGEAAR
jgi:FtsP/CotA-like multicopper oxidase with cupredoxin domain